MLLPGTLRRTGRTCPGPCSPCWAQGTPVGPCTLQEGHPYRAHRVPASWARHLGCSRDPSLPHLDPGAREKEKQTRTHEKLENVISDQAGFTRPSTQLSVYQTTRASSLISPSIHTSYLAGRGIGHPPDCGYHGEGSCWLIGLLLPTGGVIGVRTVAGSTNTHSNKYGNCIACTLRCVSE